MKPLAQNSMIQGRYLVVQMIGKGGMGEVYLAVDQRLGSTVALKRTFFSENDGLATAFEREARILGRLRHPVLPKVIDHFGEGTDQYLVMEHITGEDLGKRLEQAGKPFPLSWVMFWSDQMLDALNYLHSHEPPIIHRDIKPENLKLTDDNHIVLLDFGLSKDFASGGDTASLGTGSVVGYSPYFASMEQVRGTGTDARSDLYSFSATIYQLLTNTMPADSLTRADAILGGKPDPVEAISSINPEVSAAVSEVILKGLSVRQDERFVSAAEMQKALRRAYNAAEPEAASAPSEAKTRQMAVPTEIMAGTGFAKPQTPTNPPAAVDVESTIPVENEAKTQIITYVPEPAEENVGIPDETAMLPDQTAIMPDATAELGRATTDAAIRQADIHTQVMAEPPHAAEEPYVEQAAAAGASAAFVSQATATMPPKKKSKAGIIVGGLIGLLVLAGLVAGGGWFAYNKYYLPSITAASPTPTATPEMTVSPTPQPSPTLAEASPSPEASTEVSDANTSTPANRSTTPVDTHPTTGPIAKSPTNTVRTPPTTSPKATPKPKGRDDRTVILQ